MKRNINLLFLFIILFFGLLVSCRDKGFRKAPKYSDEIWAIIPEKEKEVFKHLSDEDAMSTYTLVDIKWGEAVQQLYPTCPDPDESLLNSATSAKYLSMDDDSEFKKTHTMPTVFARYYKEQYKKTGEQKYLDKILVIADHLRQNRDFPPAPISEWSTLIYYLETLKTISETDLKKKGYKKQEINELYIKMQENFNKCITVQRPQK